jgi:hypothetical protein
MLRIAKRGGRLLVGLKKLVGHGEWLSWLQKNLPQIDVRTAQNWQRIWRNWNQIEENARANAKTVSHLGMVEALALIRTSRPKSEATPQDDRRVHVPQFEAQPKAGQSADAQSANEEPAKTEEEQAPKSVEKYVEELGRQLQGDQQRVYKSFRPFWADSTASTFEVGRRGNRYHLVVKVAGEIRWVFHSIDRMAAYDLLLSIRNACQG